MLTVKRIYEPAEPGDGVRILVDRLWPRGIAKDKAEIDDWLREIAPSAELRTWYGHDPGRYAEFAQRYRRELRDPAHVQALQRLREVTSTEPAVTLLTATRDLEHAHTAVLAEVLG